MSSPRLAFFILVASLHQVFTLRKILEAYKHPKGRSVSGIESYEFLLQQNKYSAAEILVKNLRLFDRNFTLDFKKLKIMDSTVTLWEKDDWNVTCYWSWAGHNESSSVAILNNCNNQMIAIIQESRITYLVEPESPSEKQGRHIAYRITSNKQPCVILKAPEQRETFNEVQYKKRHSRSIKSSPTIEVLVVADESMVKFHGNETVREYVLTIMAKVRKIFRSINVGVRVNLVVSNLIILTGKEKNLSIGHNADKTMKSFCHWQSDQNNGGKTNHDVALLLTRLNICSDKDEPCSTVGMAYISGMCQSQRRCSVAEDTGLDVALTIAHELGHNLGIRHDGYGNECADQTRDIPHIMASMTLKANKRGLSQWSKCSKRMLKNYLRTSSSWCLRDTRSKTTVPLPNTLPGVTFSADDQCKHQYGNLARQCKRNIRRLCQELWCEIEGEHFCRTKLSPAAFGTKCGEDKWCMYGDCVNSTSVLIKRDGGWSAWGRWGECSRSCGTGVSTNRRECSNPKPKNGGRYCLGQRERYRLCNQEECPEASKEIRTDQCESFNNKIYKEKLYSWKPLHSKHKPCALFCTPTTEERFSVQFSSKVIDGTPCMPGASDLCVDGKCHRVGCDKKIGSDAKEDICGVCRGNGTTCRAIEGSFNQVQGSGYVEVAVIPVGARNIQVMETKPCTSFLALKGSYDTYYVNGNWKIQLPGQVDVEGTKVIYDRKGTWERLVAKGPTKEPLHVMVLYHGYNLGIKYKYSVPLPNKSQEMSEDSVSKQSPSRKKVNYGWVRRGWEKCSVVCGNGVQKSRREECVSFLNGKFEVVNEVHCRHAKKPKRDVRVCNEHPCPIWWSVTRWSKCSHSCGSGRQHRLVFCMRQFSNGTIAKSSNELCTKDKPSSKQNCYLRSCRVKWITKPWSKCYTICGKGYRFRVVRCPLKGLCNPNAKPASRKLCYGESCFSWNAEEWGRCSRSCGYGYQLRKVKCEHKLTNKLGRRCNRFKKPSEIRLCRNRQC